MTPTKPATLDKRIETLFLRFGAIYGHIWWSAYKNAVLLEAAKKEWSESLVRFNNHTVKAALLKCREEKEFPPTLPQFIECCKAVHRRFDPGFARREPITPAKLEVAEAAIKEMLKVLTH